MSKIVKVYDNDYRLSVNQGGTIILDTGENVGGVVVTGNLTILGAVFNITAENTLIKDNIIVLNSGEVGLGITVNANQSGIEIDRGALPNAKFLFDENITRPNSLLTQINAQGSFVLKDENNSILPIRTNHINTAGNNLYLINSGNGVISVEGTVNYASRVTSNDHIPNKKYVDDAIAAGLAEPDYIVDGNSRLTVSRGIEGQLVLNLNGSIRAIWDRNYHQVQNILIVESRIEPTISNRDLILSSAGAGHVQIDDSMRLKQLPFTPPGLSDSTIVFSKNPGRGETGLYFTTPNNIVGEFISARRALAYSVIF